MEDSQISVTPAKNVKYHHRLFYFLMWDLGKFKGKCHIACAKDKHKVLASFFGTPATFKSLMQFLEYFYEKI